MKLYCANCGLHLKVIRKALQKLGTIIDLVEPHKCLETPIDPATIMKEAPLSSGDQNKFVESLNELNPPTSHGIAQGVSEGKSLRPSSMTGTGDLRDRRFDQSKIPSTAPSSVLDQIKQMGNSIPVHDIRDDSAESEMGG